MTAAVAATGPALVGHRSGDAPLLTGHRLPGELLARPLPGRPALSRPVTVPAPGERADERLYVVRDQAFVRVSELDWVHRRARLEIGVHAGAAPDAERLLAMAVVHGFEVLNLHRLHGWVTPAVSGPDTAPAAVGFVREARVARAIWFDGQPVDREVWGIVRHG